MRRKIVAGNWKLNGDLSFVREFSAEFLSAIEEVSDKVSVILAPPAVLLSALAQEVLGREVKGAKAVSIAGQNVSEYVSGAYTGEISALMLKDVGCEWCLVGHSERRALFFETDAVVLGKVRALLEQGVNPILCVGETLEEREQGRAVEVVSTQVRAVYSQLSEEALKRVVIAYEPVWAIGTGKTASPEQAQEMHAAIRALVAEVSGQLAQEQVILYGGSVNAANAKELFAQVDIDGGLVGGASLKPQDFAEICRSI